MSRSDDVVFNGADLRYLRVSLLASRAVHRASDVARASASDPRVRALAHRARATQAEDIRAITSILAGWGQSDDGPAQAGAGDQRTPAGPEAERPFVEVLSAHARASLVSARTEMVEGFDGSSRLLAEQTSRAHWRMLDSLKLFAAADPGGTSVVR